MTDALLTAPQVAALAGVHRTQLDAWLTEHDIIALAFAIEPIGALYSRKQVEDAARA